LIAIEYGLIHISSTLPSKKNVDNRERMLSVSSLKTIYKQIIGKRGYEELDMVPHID
jgi:phenylalanyl-tRNA synthetase beta subunit